MKTGPRFLGSTFLGLCASLGCAGLVHAQVWVPTTVSLLSVSVVTAGQGIPLTTNTCAEYKWGLFGGERIHCIGPLIRNGRNFSYNFDIEEEIGVPVPMFVILETTTVVLGNLAPGTYTLITTSWSVPIATNIFTIPFPTPILHPIGFAGDGSFQIQMSNGVTNASYVLQCSPNCVDWTSISTNSIEQQLRDPSPVVPGSRYYRVQILQP